MKDNPYRPCPMCRTHLQKPEGFEEVEKTNPEFKWFVCINCGTEVWLKPFAQVLQARK